MNQQYGIKFSDLVGRTMTAVERLGDIIEFLDTQGWRWVLSHQQDCCESVCIEDVCGDLEDLVGSPILVALEDYNSGADEHVDSQTWSFYTFRTMKGTVTIRFYGTSNGYYSETACLQAWSPDPS